MKPTNNQIEFLEALKDHLSHLQTTNDLHSPSHFTIEEEEVAIITEAFGLEEESSALLSSVLTIIRQITILT